MLNALFTFADGKVAAASLAVLVVSFTLLYFISPKNEIHEALGDRYVATDSPAQTERLLWYGYETCRVTGMLTAYNEREKEREHDKSKTSFYALHERFILRHDLFFPPFYAIPLVLLLAYLHRWAGGAPRWVVLLPLAAMAFDYAENFTMLLFLRAFRDGRQSSTALLELSRAFTVLKWYVLLLPLVIFFAVFVVSRFRTGPAAPQG